MVPRSSTLDRPSYASITYRPHQRWDVFGARDSSEWRRGTTLPTMRTAAVRDGRHYVINGREGGTSYFGRGGLLYFCFLLARTTPLAETRISECSSFRRTSGFHDGPSQLLDIHPIQITASHLTTTGAGIGGLRPWPENHGLRVGERRWRTSVSESARLRARSAGDTRLLELAGETVGVGTRPASNSPSCRRRRHAKRREFLSMQRLTRAPRAGPRPRRQQARVVDRARERIVLAELALNV